MQTAIGPYNDATRIVPVTFTLGDVVHRRDVNACLDEDGGYDLTATAERVADVARGVAVKIGLGAIREPDPIPAPAEDVAAEED